MLRYVRYETAERLFQQPGEPSWPMAFGISVVTLAVGGVVKALTGSAVTGVIVAGSMALVISSAETLYADHGLIAETVRSVLVFCGCRAAPLAEQAQAVEPAMTTPV